MQQQIAGFAFEATVEIEGKPTEAFNEWLDHTTDDVNAAIALEMLGVVERLRAQFKGVRFQSFNDL